MAGADEVDQLAAQLNLTYDRYAEDRAARAVGGDRARWREEFADLVLGEGRASLIEVGCGPGRDLSYFASAGVRAVGIDPSARSVALAGEAGLRVGRASATGLPFRSACFDAAFTMSTLIHVPHRDIDAALAELYRLVPSDAPVAIGLWGGVDWEGVLDTDLYDPPRFFAVRADATLRTLIEPHAVIERFEVGETDPMNPAWHYQFVLTRAR